MTDALHVLREYALIADGERGALVGPRGDIVWMAFPQWHDDAVFAALVGGAGVYAIAPSEPFVWGGYYEPRSLIWRSRFVTSSNAIVECREALALPSHRSRAVSLRRIVAARGRSRIAITLNPCAGFGRHPLRRLRRRDSCEWDAMLGGVHVCVAGASTAVADVTQRQLRGNLPQAFVHAMLLECAATIRHPA